MCAYVCVCVCVYVEFYMKDKVEKLSINKLRAQAVNLRFLATESHVQSQGRARRIFTLKKRNWDRYFF